MLEIETIKCGLSRFHFQGTGANEFVEAAHQQVNLAFLFPAVAVPVLASRCRGDRVLVVQAIVDYRACSGSDCLNATQANQFIELPHEQQPFAFLLGSIPVAMIFAIPRRQWMLKDETGELLAIACHR